MTFLKQFKLQFLIPFSSICYNRQSSSNNNAINAHFTPAKFYFNYGDETIEIQGISFYIIKPFILYYFTFFLSAKGR